MVRIRLCHVQGVRNKARLLWVRTQYPVILLPGRVVESNRKRLWYDPLLDPVHKRLECRRRLPPGSTRAVRQSWNLKVAEEVLDIGRLLCGSVVVVAGSSGWDKTISLLHCSVLVLYRLKS